MSFPSTIDTIANPNTGDTLGGSSTRHSQQHVSANTIVSALQTKVGIDGSAVSTSIDYKLNQISSPDKALGVSATQTLFNKTISGGTVSGATFSSGVVSAAIPVLGVSSYAPAAAGTATLMLSQAQRHFIQMPAGNITVAVSGGYVNEPFLLEMAQDSVGSRTATWFAGIRWPGGSAPILTTTANKKDAFGFIVSSSTSYDAYIVGQNL